MAETVTVTVTERSKATLVGIPFSTFTRTIAMALHLKGVSFDQVAVPPHSPTAKLHHPLGRIPSFSHPPGEWLFESAAIATYIDTTFSHPPLLRPVVSSSSSLSSRLENARVTQWVSFVSDYAFNILEHQVIKPTLALQQIESTPQAENEHHSKEKEELTKKLAGGTKQAKELLTILETHLSSTTTANTQEAQYGGVTEMGQSHRNKEGPFWFGSEISWVDLYLAPIIADLAALSIGVSLLQDTPALRRWFQYFSKQECFLRTFEGTLAEINSQKAKV